MVADALPKNNFAPETMFLCKQEIGLIAFVPRIAPFRSNITHIDPNQRLFPSEHTLDPTRFAGTLLSAVDLFWFN